MGKIILEDTRLVIDNVQDGGGIAVAVATKRPVQYVSAPDDPPTAPCWIAWLIASAPEDVPKVREKFSAATGLPVEELENVIAVGPDVSRNDLAKALEVFNVAPGGRLPAGALQPLSCSVGGRDALVTLSGQPKDSFKADWCILKGEHVAGNCRADQAKVWRVALTADDKEEITAEVRKPTSFNCG